MKCTYCYSIPTFNKCNYYRIKINEVMWKEKDNVLRQILSICITAN
jgi:hypothetical protein